MRSCCSLVVWCALVLSTTVARAQSRVLLAADNPKHIAQVELAQIMASDSTRWLSVRLTGQARLALISSASLEALSSGDAWLRALDFATRERIAAPPGPLAVCPERASFPLADSGRPESASVPAQPATTASSDLELQRLLADAGIELSLAGIAEFSASDPAPYRVILFDAPAGGGASAAVRWLEHGSSNQVPKISIAGLDSLPLSLITLAKDAVLPAAGGGADPSELKVTYFALSATSDYPSARVEWQQDNAQRWLAEAVKTPTLFDDTVLAGEGAISSAVFRYFSALTGNADRAGPCISQAKLARSRGSSNSADFTCAGADDLARTESELDFADVRLTRWFGSTNAPSAFTVEPAAEQSPRLQATDFDTKGCSPPRGAMPGGMPVPGAGRTGTPGTGTGTGTGTFSTGEVDTSVAQTSADEGGCSLRSDTSDDSCNGDSSPGHSESTASDSCSGDSSSSDTSDSCSGDSESSDDEPSGCGSDDKSGYDGDTCSGNSASSTHEGLKSPRQARPRRLRLSLLMLLAAGLSLPLRRGLK